MTQKKDKSLFEPIETEILNPGVDLSVDYAEIGLDALIDNEVISEIPIVKSIIGITKIGLSIKERYNLKKLLVFFKEFEEGKVSGEKRNQFREKFNSNEKYRTKVVETILILNERFLDVTKSKILANLFNAHIEGNLNWNELNDIVMILDVIHPRAFGLLQEMSNQNWSNHNKRADDEPFVSACGIALRFGSKFSITKMGQDLFNYGIKPSLRD